MKKSSICFKNAMPTSYDAVRLQLKKPYLSIEMDVLGEVMWMIVNET